MRNKHVGGMSYPCVCSQPPGGPDYEGHLGAHGAYMGAPGVHFGAHGAHLGAHGSHLGAHGAHLRVHGAYLGAPGSPGVHLGAHGAQFGAPGAYLGAQTEYLGPPNFKFQHPCSLVLTGPSGSGKSVLTKKVLCQGFIKPPPQRIIWCYGQYQPLYDNVKKHLPGVEFVKGIPDFIEQDTHLDTYVRNCIILDDLMGDAKRDERVANLFTKGSHHRNLTVL